MIMTEDDLKPMEIKHDRAMRLLDIRPSFYWKLVWEGRIRVVGSGKDGRADFASVERYHRERLAETGQAA